MEGLPFLPFVDAGRATRHGSLSRVIDRRLIMLRHGRTNECSAPLQGQLDPRS